MSRESTSRPKESVPSQCAALGGASMAPKSTASGSYGAMRGAVSATSTMTTTTTAPIAPSGRRRQNANTLWIHRLRGATTTASAMSSGGVMAIVLLGGGLGGPLRNLPQDSVARAKPALEPDFVRVGPNVSHR